MLPDDVLLERKFASAFSHTQFHDPDYDLDGDYYKASKLDEAAQAAALSLLRFDSDLFLMADRQLVIEAVVEDETIKTVAEIAFFMPFESDASTGS